MKIFSNMGFWGLFLVFLFFVSCEDSADQRFDLELEADFTMPAQLNLIETHFFILKNIPTFIDQKLSFNGMSKSSISAIHPGDASIYSAFFDVDWSFVEDVEVYLISTTDLGLRKRVFYVRGSDFNDRSKVGLFNTFSDVSEILKDEFVNAEVRIKLRTFTPGTIDARIKMVFGVF